MTRLLIGCLAAAALLAAPAEAQQHQLVGKWESVDQPGKWAEFLANGEFHYRYGTGPTPITLQIYWKTGWSSALTLGSKDGQSVRSCKYRIEGDTLTIDNGSGKSCIDNRPIEMAMKFRRAK